LAETDLPSHIDSSLLRNLSGSAQSSLLGTLRYLKLIGENKAPTETFRALVHAKEKERGPILKTIVEGAYPFLSAGTIDLAKATPAVLADAMRDLGASGGTLDKSVAFFLGAAKAAGITVSPHILKRKSASPGSSTRRARPAARTKNDTEGEGSDDETEIDGLGLAPLLVAFLRTIPSTDVGWPGDQRVRWFRAFAMNVSQVYDEPQDAVDLKIDLVSGGT
jgi:hypothetical protein